MRSPLAAIQTIPPTPPEHLMRLRRQALRERRVAVIELDKVADETRRGVIEREAQRQCEGDR